MTAFHNMMLSGHGLPEMPPGGSLESRLKSRIRRLLQLVDYNQTRREQKIHGRDRQNELTMTVITGESWSLGSQQQRLFCLVLHRRLVSLMSRGHPVPNTKHFMLSVSQQPCVSPNKDHFIFISGDECFNVKIEIYQPPVLNSLK